MRGNIVGVVLMSKGNNGNMRGQAAMEYLMTYGWALLVIAVVIAILLTINPFQSQQGCHFDQIGFLCTTPLLSSNGTLYLKVTNGNSNAVSIYAINCTTDTTPTPPIPPVVTASTQALVSLQSQQVWELNNSVIAGIPCYSPSSSTQHITPATGSQFMGKLWVFYKNEEDGIGYPVRSTSATINTKVVQAS